MCSIEQKKYKTKSIKVLRLLMQKSKCISYSLTFIPGTSALLYTSSSSSCSSRLSSQQILISPLHLVFISHSSFTPSAFLLFYFHFSHQFSSPLPLAPHHTFFSFPTALSSLLLLSCFLSCPLLFALLLTFHFTVIFTHKLKKKNVMYIS